MSVTKAQVDKFLTNVSKGYWLEGGIAEQILTPISNRKQNSGKLAGYGTNHLRLVNTVMAGQGKAPRITTRSVESDSYFIENHGLEGLVTKDDYDNVEDPFDAEKDEVDGLKQLMMVAREKSLADNLTSASILTQNVTLSGSGQLSDYANSDPIGNFNTARETIKSGCGVPPDTAIMSWEVFNKLKFHPQLLELGYIQNRTGQLSVQDLAIIMEVDRVLIGAASYETAALGQSSSLGPIWGKHIVFGKLPTTARKRQVSLGYTIRKGGESQNQVFSYMPGNPPGSKAVIVTDNYDDLLSNVSAGYLIRNAVA